MTLSNRIFLAAALLVVLAIGFTAAFVSARVTSQAEAELQRGLLESGAVVSRQSEALVETFTLLARLIADLPKLKAAVATGDPPTVQPLAADYQSMLTRSSLVVVTDRAGRELAAAGPAVQRPVRVEALPSVREALTGGQASSFRAHHGGILQVLSVPITVGGEPARLAGTLSVGFLLGNAQASEFKQLTGSEIAFGFGGRIRASTLPEAAWPAIEQARRADRVSTAAFDQDEYVLLSAPLASGSVNGLISEGSSPEDAPFVVVVRSRTERLQFLGPIQTVIAVTVLVTMLFATVLSYAVARTVTRPLAAITGVMREVAATGDLTRKIPAGTGRWEDEDTRLLASTFNTLTDSVARFEKEAAQRERLSSLGRLSSVVAHEVRNPLMIIKAAVRTLRLRERLDGATEEAVQDIEQEVVRLNRIVSEVLDYAKPLTFTWQPVDTNAVCLDAVQAVRVAEPDVPVDIALDPQLAPIITDGDRLRTVLVNVLTNASQAAKATREAEPGASPGIGVRTAALPDGGTLITVSDEGGGIDRAQVSRVFEPYFTTRRAGTGLGLAIARNIVDGLGGTIVIESDGHTGTEVRIALPAGKTARPETLTGERTS